MVKRIPRGWAGEAAEMRSGRKGQPGAFGTVARKRGGSLYSSSLKLRHEMAHRGK